MKLKKACLTTLAFLSLISLASCKKNKDNKTSTDENSKTPVVITEDNNDNQTDKKYQIYLLAQNSGFTGTYEEWLESIKGDFVVIKVEDGKLKWKYSKEVDTSYRELIDFQQFKGEDGKSSIVTIGSNGNWYIDGEDTLIKATAVDGKGIKNIEKTSTNGLVDTYTITFTDDSTTTFTVTNGKNGDDGQAREVANITKTSSNGLIDTYTITFSDNTTSTFTVTNGKNGIDGKGILSIEKTSTEGLVDTYTITFTDNTTTTFTVTNGENAESQNTNSFDSYEFVDGNLIKTIVNIEGRQSETVCYVFKGEWIENTKKIQRYDSNHRIILDESDIWDETNNKWIGERKIEYEYASGDTFEIEYEWNNSFDSWEKPTSKIKRAYDENGNLELTEISWDDTKNDWSTTFKSVKRYKNSRIISEVNYKWSSTKNNWSEYGNATYFNDYIASETTVYATYIWESDNSGWTDASFDVRGIIVRNKVKYYGIELSYSWDKTQNKYVTTGVVQTDYEGNKTEYDSNNLPWNDDYLWYGRVNILSSISDLSYSPRIYKKHTTYFDYYYSPIVMSFIPESFTDKECIGYPLNFETINNREAYDDLMLSETIATGEYFTDNDMFSLGYTTTSKRDSNDRVIQMIIKKYENNNETTVKVVDITYSENGRLYTKNDKTYSDNGDLTETWVTTYIYDENNKWIGTLVTKKVEGTDEDFVDYWKCDVEYGTDDFIVKEYLYIDGSWTFISQW